VKRHRWGEPNRLRLKTERQCLDCGLIKVTVHEPSVSFPWVEFWREIGPDRDLVKVEHSDRTPPCQPAEVQA
jgi:hypothetical protein